MTSVETANVGKLFIIKMSRALLCWRDTNWDSPIVCWIEMHGEKQDKCSLSIKIGYSSHFLQLWMVKKLFWKRRDDLKGEKKIYSKRVVFMPGQSLSVPYFQSGHHDLSGLNFAQNVWSLSQLTLSEEIWVCRTQWKDKSPKTRQEYRQNKLSQKVFWGMCPRSSWNKSISTGITPGPFNSRSPDPYLDPIHG